MAEEPRIKASDMRFLDDLFGMGDGYVLDFSNPTFAQFFKDELNVDIDQSRFAAEGTSKAKRLRYFCRTAPKSEVIKLLIALWEYRESNRRRAGATGKIPNAAQELGKLIQRLGGIMPSEVAAAKPKSSVTRIDDVLAEGLLRALMETSQLEPQARGYAFEKFLNALFRANNLAPRDSFRNRGEQIDGSFEVESATYLLEAKWTAAKVDVSALRSFNSKVEDKATWSRGLLVSDSGFSDDGLHAFGRGKRIVCMDGLDLADMLQRRIALADVLARKVRRAAETGDAFVRVRDLY
jgi:hypothetical protein